MELNEIKNIAVELMDALKSKGLSEVCIDTKDVKIKVKASFCETVISQPLTTQVHNKTLENNETQVNEQNEIVGTTVNAPLVGTFYAAPSPEEPPYIEVGQKVKKGDTLFIIEAMKTMNEISAPCDGTISRIMAQSGDMVEYDQALAVIV